MIQCLPTSCPVCTGSATESHFGTVVCRACSAFFRRRVLSKQVVECLQAGLGNCIITAERDVPQCKVCRMKKCLEVGMNPDYVQLKRDRHNNHELVKKKRERKEKVDDGRVVFPLFENYKSALLANEIQSTSLEYSTMRLCSLHENFSKMLKLRKMSNPARKKVSSPLHFAEALSIFRKDVRFVANWILSTFPELSTLEQDQQKILFRNFYSKFTIFEPAYIAILLGKTSTYHLPTGDTVDEVGRYYTRHLQTPPAISIEEVSRLFHPFWADFHNTLIDPVIEANLTIHEFLLLCSIFLWDVGLVGQSEESTSMAQCVQQQLFRELNFVCKKKTKGNEETCFRFARNMLLLPAIQRGVIVYEDELQLGGVYRFLATDTDDWYDMVKGPI